MVSEESSWLIPLIGYAIVGEARRRDCGWEVAPSTLGNQGHALAEHACPSVMRLSSKVTMQSPGSMIKHCNFFFVMSSFVIYWNVPKAALGVKLGQTIANAEDMKARPRSSLRIVDARSPPRSAASCWFNLGDPGSIQIESIASCCIWMLGIGWTDRPG